MTANITRFFVVLAVLILTTACSSPTGPGPIDNGPKPFPGTSVHDIELPGTSTPLKVWIVNMTLPQGGTLEVGQTQKVEYACSGPAGYTAHIGSSFMSGDSIAVDGRGIPEPVGLDYVTSAGFELRLGLKCDPPGGIRNLTVKDITPDITHISYFVWVAQGGSPNTNAKPVTFKEAVNWLGRRVLASLFATPGESSLSWRFLIFRC